MADKVIGLRLRVVGTEDIVKRIGALNSELAQTQQQAKVLQKALNDATKAGDANETKRLGDELATVRARIGEIKNDSAGLNRELKLQQKAFKAAGDGATDSYKALDAQLSVLRERFKQLSAAEREGAIGQQLTADIQKLDTKLKQQDESLGVFTRNVGNYETAVLRALRRAGNEDLLQKKIEELNNETEALTLRSRQLAQQLEKADKGTDFDNTLKELREVEEQLQRNERAAKDLGAGLNDKEKTGTAGFGRRQIANVGRLAGGAGKVVGNIAGDLIGGAQAFQSFGAAAVPAFAVFAAGGLAFKALSALEGLSKEFSQLESKVAAFGGISGQALKSAAVNVKGIATTFGKEQDDVVKATGALSKSLGTDFNAVLSKLEQGFLTGADASGELLSALEGAAEGARAAGLSVDDLIVFSNEATQSGLLSERGLELVNTFGANIKTNSEEARTALQGALGKEFTDELFTNVQNGSLSTKDAIQQVSVELGKQGVSAKQASAVFVSAFGAQTAAENEFILSLNDTRKGVGDYINEANRLTSVQREQLAANKALASAQQGLAGTFESFGFSIEAVGTQIKASLLNLANGAILFFNKTFGDGIASATDAFRKFSQQLSDQKNLVAELETNYAPLLDRYDELSKELLTLDKNSTEAAAAQAELSKIVKQVGDKIPSAIKITDAYSRSLGINTDTARKFIEQQQKINSSLSAAQSTSGAEALQLINKELQEAQNAIIRDQARVEKNISEASVARANDSIIRNGRRLQELTAQAAEIEGELLKTQEGRAVVAADRALRRIQATQTASAAAFIENLRNQNVSAAADIIRTTEDLFSTNLSTQTKLFRELSAKELEALNKETQEQYEIELEEAKKQEELRKKATQASATQKAKAASDNAKQERERLIEEEKRTREALEGATKATNEAIETLSLSGIQDRTERETAAIRLSTAKRIETETQALQDAAAAQTAVLSEIAKSKDSVLRAQFGTAEEIAQRIDGINAATKKAIAQQTALILEEQQEQIDAVVEARNKAVAEALRSIDEAEISAALTEVQQRLQNVQGQQAALELGVSVDTAAIDARFAAEGVALREQRALGLITEREYQTQVTALELSAENARIQAQAQAFDERERLRTEALALQKLQIEGERQQQQAAIQATRDGQITALREQLDAQLITRAQFDEAVVFADQTAAAQSINIEANTQQEIQRIDAEGVAARAQNEQDVLDAQAEFAVKRLEAFKEEQQAILQATNEAIQNIGALVLQAAQAADDFFTASENRRKTEINSRYDTEIQRARGNAAEITRIEQRREREIEQIERKAANRRKAIAIAQAIINGAVAVTNILATSPDPTGISTAIRIGAAIATTAGQVALISSQETFEQGGSIPKGDGIISGRSHKAGGVRGTVNGHSIEAEGGEWIARDETGARVIINKHSTRLFKNALTQSQGRMFAGKRAALSAINSYGGFGVPFAAGGAIPPPVGTPTAASGALQTGQQQIAALSANIQALQQFVQATNSRIDRLVVVADAQDIVQEGAKNTPFKQAQVL